MGCGDGNAFLIETGGSHFKTRIVLIGHMHIISNACTVRSWIIVTEYLQRAIGIRWTNFRR